MHLAEGTLPMWQAAGWAVAGGLALAWSMRAEVVARRSGEPSSVLMGAATSLLFAATLLPLPVPVVGATSHICITPLMALLVGVRRVFWPAFFVLLAQALFFAHGGLTTLGANALSLGVVGPALTLVVWRGLGGLGVGSLPRVGVATAVGGLGVYVWDAGVLALALADAVAVQDTFVAVVAGFAPVQVPLAFLEAGVSVAIVRLFAERRPDLLPASLRPPAAMDGPTTGASGKGALSATLVGMIALLVGATGCTYEGIDGTVFGAVAESGGRAPVNSVVDLSQGEVGLAMTVVILFAVGFVAGRFWERHLRGDRVHAR